MNPELLLDIARLLRKYPADVWDELLQDLRSPDLHKKITIIVQEMHKLSHESRANFRRTQEDQDEVFFRRALLLDQIRADLTRRAISEVRDYGESLGVATGGVVRKELLVNRILKTLAAKNIEEIRRTRTPSLFEPSVKEDFERWGELIMGKRSRTKR